ncbi:hypothetical protein, partial [Paenibacillus sp. Y412MC10]|uniref:hypothetical protein n=1 Tax=Geobacillus sp. (strain Y412MC10) TaxID=481743 RepID=UPI00119FEA54
MDWEMVEGGGVEMKAKDEEVKVVGKEGGDLWMRIAFGDGGVKGGDEVRGGFQVDNEWEDVRMGIGGIVMVVKDGVVEQDRDGGVEGRRVVG